MESCPDCTTLADVPACVASAFASPLVLAPSTPQILVSLGQFSIVRLERDAQLIVPVLDYSLPTKACCEATGCVEDPCEMFSRIPFPENQFAPRGCDTCQTECCDH